jgi:hypothetical protein
LVDAARGRGLQVRGDDRVQLLLGRGESGRWAGLIASDEGSVAPPVMTVAPAQSASSAAAPAWSS